MTPDIVRWQPGRANRILRRRLFVTIGAIRAKKLP